MRWKFLSMASLLAFSSCLSFNVGGHDISFDDVNTARKIIQAGMSAAEDFSPEQEHYIGRTVTAKILSDYAPYENDAINRYLNTLGQYLASMSDRPETFGGYHFLAVKSDHLNAFAAPGGFIMITTGLIKQCENEDQLASILAHEIAHVQHYHGIKAIQKSRWTKVGALLATSAAQKYTKAELSSLVESFDGVITDVADTLITSGYSRAAEEEADVSATKIMKRAGYNPSAMLKTLSVLEHHHRDDGGLGLAKTHPHPKERKEVVTKAIRSEMAYVASLARNSRFKEVMSQSGL